MVLVGEVMAQQTQLERAVDHWQQWQRQWPDVAAVAQAPFHDVLQLWQGMGYPRRAKALYQCAQQIVEHGWPDDLQTLPGVGPYTAAAVQCFAFHQDVLPIDINIRRVLERCYAGQQPPLQQYADGANALMYIGQQWCRRKPLCENCPLLQDCPVGQGIQADPVIPAKTQAPFQGSFRQQRGILLRQVLENYPVLYTADNKTTADSLLADGLISRQQEYLLPPEDTTSGIAH